MSKAPAAVPAGYRIRAPHAGPNGLYCAGQVFHVAPRAVPANWLSAAQIEALGAHPDLVIEPLETL
jgi:hypothetical protein